VADASHELRTPLTHLTTRAQLLDRSLRRGDEASARAESAQLIVDGRRLSAVLEDLLLAAEPADPTEWSPVPLVAVAEAGALAVAAEAGEAGIEVTVDRPEHEVMVLAVRTALDRALLALLDNAIRHTSSGGRVTIRVRGTREWATLAVADSGSGIAPEDRDHLFDRFAHGSATHGARRRFGLGLALVADTAARFGGDVSVDSTPGAGTVMTIRLPHAAAEGPAL
jgi:signal transduction histidine kinase